ncbi:MAG: uroporphyrinogen decarboxylase family protein [Clostridia bacterium]
MTSKERVRAVMAGEKPDRTPAAFECVADVSEKLLKHYGFKTRTELLEKFEIDIRPVSPKYIGPELPSYTNEDGALVTTSHWGFEKVQRVTDLGIYNMTTYFPLNDVETMEDLAKYTFPNPDWFDYSVITEQCENNKDKAIIIGHEGPFQIVTSLIDMDRFFMLMIDEPEVAQAILDGMVKFELEHYRRCFEAGKGMIDVLRPHDDYGTQISMLFSLDMWKNFFKENTKKLADLTHEYGAFYQQHSCGAVAPIIPELIECGVDALEPVQKVKGLEIDVLAEKYKGKIVFHGGVDTQGLLPNGTAQEVKDETQYIVDTLGKDGGYILMASQAFEGDVPIENIEAVYSVKR